MKVRLLALLLLALGAYVRPLLAQDSRTNCTKIGTSVSCTTRTEPRSTGWLGVLGATMDGYAKDVEAARVRDAAAERDRRDAAMVAAQQRIAAAANAAAIREAERARMLEAADRERIAAASRLFARRANEVRRTFADSLVLSERRYKAFSDSTSVILSDLFVADPSASSARIADELRPIYQLFRRQRQEFEKTVSDAIGKAMRDQRPFASAAEVEEVLQDISALEDRPSWEWSSLIESAVERRLKARSANEALCRTVSDICDPSRLGPTARQQYNAAVKSRDAANAVRLANSERLAAQREAQRAADDRRDEAAAKSREAKAAQALAKQRAMLDRVLDSLTVTAEERTDAHSHFAETGYESIASAKSYVLQRRVAVADATALAKKKVAARQELARLSQIAREKFPTYTITPEIPGAGVNLAEELTAVLVALSSRWIDSATANGIDSLPGIVETLVTRLRQNERECLRGTSCDGDLLPVAVRAAYLSNFANLKKIEQPAAYVVASADVFARHFGTRAWHYNVPLLSRGETQLTITSDTNSAGRTEYRLVMREYTLTHDGSRSEGFSYVAVVVDSLTRTWTRVEQANDGRSTSFFVLPMGTGGSCAIYDRDGETVHMTYAKMVTSGSAKGLDQQTFKVRWPVFWVPLPAIPVLLAARLDDFLVGKSIDYSSGTYTVVREAASAKVGERVVLRDPKGREVFGASHTASDDGGIAITVFGNRDVKETTPSFSFDDHLLRVLEACRR